MTKPRDHTKSDSDIGKEFRIEVKEFTNFIDKARGV